MPHKHIDAETGEQFTLDDTNELRSELEQHWSGGCAHPSKLICKVVVANGAVQFRHQCQICGEKIGQAIGKSAIQAGCPDENRQLAISYDGQRKQALEAIYQKHIRIQKESTAGYAQKYEKYLGSDEWAAKRTKVLKRSSGVCEGCLDKNATQVHHLTYANVFDELMYQLVALCDECHKKTHRFEPVTQLEHEDLPCNGCRYGSWSDDGRSSCSKFSMTTGKALAKGGPCGPEAKELEPLR